MIKLLVVDDEIDIREFLANFFKKRKLSTYTASNGEEALRLLTKERPEIMLLDIKMPRMDGLEVLKRAKELDKNIKIIMITGREDKESEEKASRLGVVNYIHKPLEIDEFEKVVMGVVAEIEKER